MTDAPLTFPSDGSTDFNALLANDADGRTGAALFDGAVVRADGVRGAEPDRVDREPQAGDTVSFEHVGGGWYHITASWLADIVKIQGEEPAEEKAEELARLVPAA